MEMKVSVAIYDSFDCFRDGFPIAGAMGYMLTPATRAVATSEIYHGRPDES
jgi:hypothetical protein